MGGEGGARVPVPLAVATAAAGAPGYDYGLTPAPGTAHSRGGLRDFGVEESWEDGDRVVKGAPRWVFQQVERLVSALRGSGV